MRDKLVLGNWKMNGSRDSVASWCSTLRTRLGDRGRLRRGVEVGVLPPFPYLEAMAQALDGTGCRTGAQDLSPDEAGAFTGDVSGSMLVDLGCAFVLAGHSERRQLHGESDAVVAAKLAAALRTKLVPVLCVGETLDERETGVTERVLERQLAAVLSSTSTTELTRVVLAYEPVWAIGTGRTATPAQAQEVHAFLRRRIAATATALGQSMPILYGGSVKAKNAAELFAMPDVDGGLIGGASLDAAEFAAILAAAAECRTA